MEGLFEGYNDLKDDYLWMPRVNTTLYGKRNKITQKFTNNILAIRPETTNINPSNVAGYITQLVTIQMGDAEVGDRIVLPNKVLKVVLFPSISQFQLLFTFSFPVGNCKLQIWEAVPR